MEPENKNESFSYTYSAKQQKEVESIRKKYLPKEEDKMTQLRKLDESVAQKAMIVSLTVGIISTLLLGIGMCCCMEFGESWFIPGIIIGLIGIIGICLAYPLYVHVTNKERERIAPEIIRLTDELLK